MNLKQQSSLTVFIPFFVQQWIYGSNAIGDLHSNSFIGMAYGPPAKKPKTENDEETKHREQDRYSNGMACSVIKRGILYGI